MAIIQPFQALRPQQQLSQQVASKPYDVLNTEEAKAEAEGNPFSFLHVTKSEIDLPQGTDLHSETVYQKAKENLEQFISNGILFKEDRPCYYIYRLVMKGRSQTGLVCVSAVEDYFNDVIKKHEFTRPEKEKDRIDHMRTIGAQTGNVFMASRDVPELNKLISNWSNENQPAYNFTAADGVQHAIWVVNDPETVERITDIYRDKVPATYIADGHHRAASAAKVSKLLPNSAEAKFFLTTIFPASELAIMDYNRVVKDLNGLSTSKFIALLQDDFFITLSSEPVKPAQPYEYGMYIDRQWYILGARKGTFGTDPISVLDISVLSDNLLDKILGIEDQRTDKRIDFVGGIRGLKELEKRVDSGEMKVAFSIYPVTIEQLFAIADSGKVMPPKTTWFEPKLRDGLLTHVI